MDETLEIQRDVQNAAEGACADDGFFMPTRVVTTKARNGYRTQIEVFSSRGFFDFCTTYPDGYVDMSDSDRRKALKSVITLSLRKIVETLEGKGAE